MLIVIDENSKLQFYGNVFIVIEKTTFSRSSTAHSSQGAKSNDLILLHPLSSFILDLRDFDTFPFSCGVKRRRLKVGQNFKSSAFAQSDGNSI